MDPQTIMNGEYRMVNSEWEDWRWPKAMLTQTTRDGVAR